MPPAPAEGADPTQTVADEQLQLMRDSLTSSSPPPLQFIVGSIVASPGDAFMASASAAIAQMMMQTHRQHARHAERRGMGTVQYEPASPQRHPAEHSISAQLRRLHAFQWMSREHAVLRIFSGGHTASAAGSADLAQ